MVPRAGIEPATRGFLASLGNFSNRCNLFHPVSQLVDGESKIIGLALSVHFKPFHLIAF
jgi:hypothetical protein